MKHPGTILAGAQARLLDPTIPYRYFATAIVFHVALWALIAVYADEVAVFSGGTGPALAAIHALTLGVLAATAMGASFQMLPVASGVRLRSAFLPRVASWFFIPGVVVLVAGMGASAHEVAALGGFAVAIGLALFVILVADLLIRAPALAMVGGFGLAALACLVLAIATGLLLVMDVEHGFLAERARFGMLHALIAGFGFMGLLAFGFSHILVPLFVLSPGVPAGEARAVFALALAGLVAALAGVQFAIGPLAGAGAVLGLASAGLHVRALARCLANGMRKNLGVAAWMMRLAWALLIAAPILGYAAAMGLVALAGLRLFVFVLLFGWLLTFLLAVLQRILPFLGAMNATGVPPRPSELAPEAVLKAHAAFHVLALVLLAAGLVFESALPVRIGGVAGTIGALLYAGFAVRVWWLIHGRAAAPAAADERSE